MIFINSFNYADREIYNVRKCVDILPVIQIVFKVDTDANRYLCFAWLSFCILFRLNKNEDK